MNLERPSGTPVYRSRVASPGALTMQTSIVAIARRSRSRVGLTIVNGVDDLDCRNGVRIDRLPNRRSLPQAEPLNEAIEAAAVHS